jgi:hypothetical protein
MSNARSGPRFELFSAKLPVLNDFLSPADEESAGFRWSRPSTHQRGACGPAFKVQGKIFLT